MIRYNIERKTEETVGQHDEAVRCLIRSKEHNFIISGSWDQEISIWDPRQRTRIVSRPQNERVYAMDCVDNTLVVGTAQRKFLIWDLRNWGKFITAFRRSSYLLGLIVLFGWISSFWKFRFKMRKRFNRFLDVCQQKRESNLKYQTRAVKCFPNGIGFVVGSIEGRVAVEYFDPSAEAQKKRF